MAFDSPDDSSIDKIIDDFEEEEGGEESTKMDVEEPDSDVPDFLKKSMLGLTPPGCSIINSAGDGYVALVTHGEYNILKSANEQPLETLQQIFSNLTIKDDETGQTPINRKIGRITIGAGYYFVNKLFGFYDSDVDYNWIMVIQPNSAPIGEMVQYYNPGTKDAGYDSDYKTQIIIFNLTDNDKKTNSWLRKISISHQSFINCADLSAFKWSPNYEGLNFEEFHKEDTKLEGSTPDKKNILYGTFFLDWQNIAAPEGAKLYDYVSENGQRVIDIFNSKINDKTKDEREYLFLWTRRLGVEYVDATLCQFLTNTGRSNDKFAEGFKNNKLGDRLGRIIQMVFIFNQDHFWEWKTGIISRINYGFLIYQIYLNILGEYEMNYILKDNFNAIKNQTKNQKVKFALRQTTINSLISENLCDFSFQPFFINDPRRIVNIWEMSSKYYELINLLNKEVPEPFNTLDSDFETYIKNKNNNVKHDILWTIISHGEIIQNISNHIGNIKMDKKSHAIQSANELIEYKKSIGINWNETEFSDRHIIFVLNCTPFTLYSNLKEGYTYEYANTISQQNMAKIISQQNMAKIISEEKSENEALIKLYNYHYLLLQLLYGHSVENLNFDDFIKAPMLRYNEQKMQQVVMRDETTLDPNNTKYITRSIQKAIQSGDAYSTPIKTAKTRITLVQDYNTVTNPKEKRKIWKKIFKQLKREGITNVKSWVINEHCNLGDQEKISKKKAKQIRKSKKRLPIATKRNTIRIQTSRKVRQKLEIRKSNRVRKNKRASMLADRRRKRASILTDSLVSFSVVAMGKKKTKKKVGKRKKKEQNGKKQKKKKGTKGKKKEQKGKKRNKREKKTTNKKKGGHKRTRKKK